MRVAIIGAGICGLYIAWKLAKEGNDITVFEKKEKIGKEACSGLFSERILNFIPESQKLIQKEIESCLIHFPKKTIKIKFSKKFLIMNHSELDKLVADLAQGAGVKIALKYNVSAQDIDTFKNNFEKIIGCDGALSEIRKYLNLPLPKLFLGIQNYIPLYDSLESQKNSYVETWATEKGFIWKIIRLDKIEYGIMEEVKSARVILEKFLKKNNLKIKRINSAIIPQGLVIPSSPQITICGDAAGLTKPWSGGGVVWSLIAANILLKNFPNFIKYKNEIERFFLPKIIFSRAAKKLVYFFGFKLPWLLPKNMKVESDFLI